MPPATPLPTEPAEQTASDTVLIPAVTAQPINGQPSGLQPAPNKTKRMVMWSLIAAGLVAVISLVVGIIWYTVQLSPVSSDTNKRIPVTIASGMTPSDIGDLLESSDVIRSSTAFDIYTRQSGTRGSLQAGTYRLAPSDSTQTIVEHITNGAVDAFTITFLPGATLAENRQVLIDAGYSVTEVDAALAKTYQSALFDTKPAGSDLEGYIYGETYQFGAGAAVEQILEHTFAIYLAALTENDIITGMNAQGLTLYQGITLASIVEREAITPTDRNQVAQVFYTRLAMGMMLGSDVTYQYIADKTGVARDVNLDSPYNTRRYAGLPPGPISSPGLTSLQAVARPASGDYVYFLSGDDDITYFARTNAEHEANISAHCQVKCSTL